MNIFLIVIKKITKTSIPRWGAGIGSSVDLSAPSILCLVLPWVRILCILCILFHNLYFALICENNKNKRKRVCVRHNFLERPKGKPVKNVSKLLKRLKLVYTSGHGSKKTWLGHFYKVDLSYNLTLHEYTPCLLIKWNLLTRTLILIYFRKEITRALISLISILNSLNLIYWLLLQFEKGNLKITIKIYIVVIHKENLVNRR